VNELLKIGDKMQEERAEAGEAAPENGTHLKAK
jgi:hypothetical protein